MLRLLLVLPILAFWLPFQNWAANADTKPKPKEKLSDYAFFEGPLQDLNPKANLIAYELATPLFSDYAQKARFIYLPPNSSINYQATGVLDFPIGSILIKNFYYWKDERNPALGRQIIETRLLLHLEQGWETLNYIWNEAQSEAYLDLAGDHKQVTWRAKNGKKHKLDYAIPNKNQCKGCHSYNQQIMPIGPSAKQLNFEIKLEEKSTINQLSHWARQGKLVGLPEQADSIPKIAIWDDPKSASLELRARAWLDINCAHCHRPEGAASTSGLFLQYEESNPNLWGVYKAPIAAGRGSGGLQFDIVPGQPDKSIFIYRMQSLDPGVMMPEIARKMVHKEGLELVREWIASMKPEDYKK